MSDPMKEDEAHAKARRGRNIMLALALAALVVLTFVISIINMSQTGHVPARF